MALARRIERLASDAHVYINCVVSDGTYVGVVKFNSSAETVKPLTLIDGNREELAQSAQQSPGGGTCIGCGILKAIEVGLNYFSCEMHACVSNLIFTVIIYG